MSILDRTAFAKAMDKYLEDLGNLADTAVALEWSIRHNQEWAEGIGRSMMRLNRKWHHKANVKRVLLSEVMDRLNNLKTPTLQQN